MADNKPTTNYYKNLGGVNAKASLYELSIAQFLNLRNVDFDVPNALSKRPGSSLYSSQSLSGPVLGLFEFQKLLNVTGQVPNDFIMANANGNVFYNTPNAATLPTAFTLLSQNYGATQPVDFLTFANKVWMANGTKWEQWNGSTVLPAGLPVQLGVTGIALDGSGGDELWSSYLFNKNRNRGTGGNSYMLVNGATMIFAGSGAALRLRGVYLAYSYNRLDGYGGPADFLATARNIVDSGTSSNGAEFFSEFPFVIGFSAPSGRGVTSLSIWLAEDTVTQNSLEEIPGVGQVNAGVLGWQTSYANLRCMSYTLKPTADLSRFWLFTTIPTSNLFTTIVTGSNGVSAIAFGITLSFGQTFAFYDGQPQPGFAFSAIAGDFFSSFIPKYIDINQNRMFVSGFSSLPSSFSWSEVGAPETYDIENFVEVRTNDGDRIFGQTSFNNQYLVFKENSFHRLIGDSTDNYQLVQISDQYGCLSNKSIVQYDQKCLWLDRKGIVEYNGANHTIVSTAVEGIFRRMNVTAAKERAVGVHHKYRNQIWWGIPIDGSTVNNLTVVYDYLVNGWTFFDGFNPSSFAIITGALTRQTAWRGDYTGFVHFTGESFFNDSGSGISCVIGTRFEASGENNTWIWRRFFLDVATATGLTGVLNGKVFSDYNQSTVQATFQMYQNSFQSRAEMGVVGKAVAAEVGHFSASLPLLINGYSWTRRGLRNL